jgi:hypothetical protein
MVSEKAVNENVPELRLYAFNTDVARVSRERRALEKKREMS